MSPQNPRQVDPVRSNARLITVIFGFAILALFVIGVVGAAWFYQLRKKQAPAPPPVYGKISAPTFTDSRGTSFSISQLDGRVWVFDSIYTRCGGQCPIMSVNMKKLQEWLITHEQGGVKLVSITVDPEYDTPEALARYAKMFKADTSRWHFLTGDKKEIYDWIMHDFKLGVDENQGQPVSDMFIHSDKFVLVDRDRNIRGYFSGMDDEDLEKLRTAIRSLGVETSDELPHKTAGPDDGTSSSAAAETSAAPTASAGDNDAENPQRIAP